MFTTSKTFSLRINRPSLFQLCCSSNVEYNTCNCQQHTISQLTETSCYGLLFLLLSFIFICSFVFCT